MAPNSNSSQGLYMSQTYSFLSPETFETLVEGYINQLHIRKRNKALITQQLANDCLMVLTNPENTAIFNPKFRWWVRKHFVFTVVGELRILLDKKNGKPVCVREQLYDKVCYFHHIIGHGGRDKTFAAITKSYSKVPAELVSLFTKNCQTCLGVRKYSKNKRPILPENEYPPHHPHRQQQQQSSSASAGLTCDTSFSITSSTAPSASSAYSPSQQQYAMVNKGDQGTMTPISPLMHTSNSGFFGNANNGQFNTGYTYPQQSTQQQQLNQLQQQQIQQMHNVAMHAHHMSLSMGLSELSLGNNTGMSPSDMSGLSGLGQLNTSGLQGSMSALSSACSTPTTMVKMDLPVVHSFDNNLISLAQLTQQNQYQSFTDGTTDLDDTTSSIHHHMYDRDQVDSFAAAAVVSAGQYSPLLEHEYQTTQSQYQDAYNQHAYATHDYTAYTTEPQSAYSMAMSSLASMTALMPSQAPNGYDNQQQPHDYSTTNTQEHSPLLSQNQMFQKQIQQEQQRFHQQQQHLMTTTSSSTSLAAAPIMTTPPTLNVSTSLSSLSTSASSSSLASPPPSAVPSLTCSIPTPTTATSSSLHSGGAPFHHHHHHQQQHHHHLTGLLDHEAKNRLGAVGGLISGVVHDL